MKLVKELSAAPNRTLLTISRRISLFGPSAKRYLVSEIKMIEFPLIGYARGSQSLLNSAIYIP